MQFGRLEVDSRWDHLTRGRRAHGADVWRSLFRTTTEAVARDGLLSNGWVEDQPDGPNADGDEFLRGWINGIEPRIGKMPDKKVIFWTPAS